MTDQAARFKDFTDAAQQLACIKWMGEVRKREEAAKARAFRDPMPLPVVCRLAREEAAKIEFLEVEPETDE